MRCWPAFFFVIWRSDIKQVLDGHRRMERGETSSHFKMARQCFIPASREWIFTHMITLIQLALARLT